jgi:hypothetical protein
MDGYLRTPPCMHACSNAVSPTPHQLPSSSGAEERTHIMSPRPPLPTVDPITAPLTPLARVHRNERSGPADCRNSDEHIHTSDGGGAWERPSLPPRVSPSIWATPPPPPPHPPLILRYPLLASVPLPPSASSAHGDSSIALRRLILLTRLTTWICDAVFPPLPRPFLPALPSFLPRVTTGTVSSATQTHSIRPTRPTAPTQHTPG